MKTLLLLITLTTMLLANIGEVTALSGYAQLQRKNKVSDVLKGAKILQKDRITTATHSKVQVILNDDTVITIGPDSEYSFESYEDHGNAQVMMKITRGFFKAVTGKIGKVAPQKFKIKTRAATIGVRGTQFMAYVTENEEHIGCIQGEIIVWTEEGTFIMAAGKMIVYKNRHWKVYKIEMSDFAPVLIGMLVERPPLDQNRLQTPSSRNSYLLEEQIVKEAEEKDQEAYTLALKAQESEEIPSFLYDDFLIDTPPGFFNPFTLGATSNIPNYLLQEQTLQDQSAPVEPFGVGVTSNLLDDTPAYLLQKEILDITGGGVEPFGFGLNNQLLEEQTGYLLEEQTTLDQPNTTEPFSFDLGSDTSTPPPSFNP